MQFPACLWSYLSQLFWYHSENNEPSSSLLVLFPNEQKVGSNIFDMTPFKSVVFCLFLR